MREVANPPRVAVMLPGSGSSAGFVHRSFGSALRAAGHHLVIVDPVPGPHVVEDAFRDLAVAVSCYRPILVGGVSLGAHVVARWAAAGTACRDGDGGGSDGVAGLLLALPAWTGPPGPVAAASAQAAATVRQHGTVGALRLARAAGVPWVMDELAAAWPGYGGELAATLDATARSSGPTPAQLRSIDVPVGLVAFADDPLHPAEVATQWQTLIPTTAVERLRLADAADDRAVLGAAGVRALRRVGVLAPDAARPRRGP